MILLKQLMLLTEQSGKGQNLELPNGLYRQKGNQKQIRHMPTL